MYRQYFKAILIVASFVSTPAALANSHEVIEDGPYHILLPYPPRLSIVRGSSTPAPDCSALNTRMQSWKRGIRRCSNGSSQPESYCKLLREDLRRTLKGIINEPFGRFEPEATQVWQMDYQLTAVSPSDLKQYASRNGLSIGRVKAAFSKLSRLSSLRLELGKSSYSKLLESADILQWAPQLVESVNQYGDIVITTKDKLTACELLSGEITMQANAESQLSYQVIKDLSSGETRWQLHQNLKEATQAAAGDSRQISLIAGYYIGRFLTANMNEPPADTLLMDFAGIHLEISSRHSKLRRFDDKFSLFQNLPQTTITKDDSINIKGEVHNALD